MSVTTTGASPPVLASRDADGTQGIEIWDPFKAWPRARPWLWLLLAVWVCAFQGPTFLHSLRPARDNGVDFFQEWASARNLFEGLPVYSSLREAIEHHLGLPVDTDGRPGLQVVVEVNAHPPTSILLTAPLVVLDYPDAVLAWNLFSLALFAVSLWLVGRSLGLRFSLWAVCPLLTLLLLCNPLRQQVYLGQFNLVLLFLLTGAWVAERSGRPWLAGMLVGTAAAVKLFPAFLFFYFLVRRRWSALAAGAVTVASLTVLTTLVMGADVYRFYFQEVLPQVERSQSGWTNASILGFWKRLFEPATALEHVEPLWRSPVAARAGAMVSGLAVVVLVARFIGRGVTKPQQDRGYGLALTAMLLVSPLCWDHYFLLLLIPLALVATNPPTTWFARLTFLAVALVFWMSPERLYDHFIPGGHASGVATPLLTLTVLSLPFYALLGFFILQLQQAEARSRTA